MSVIVRGMEMPNGCEQCCFNGYTKCRRMPIGFEEYPLVGERPDWCPLIEIPTPHGRLIDADEVIRIWDGATIEGSIKPLIEARPTVIEAEGSEE